MKKVYTKPAVRLDVFELNEFIAGDCAAPGSVIVNVATSLNCTKTNASVDWYNTTFGLFGNSCLRIPATDGTEGICYFAPSGGVMSTFSS